MTPTMDNLKKLAAKFGGIVEIDVYSAEEKAIQVVAPDGKQWADGNCVNMCEHYWTYIKKGDGSRAQAITTLIERVSEGLEDYDAELNG
jgi:hypothetical protein